MVQLTPESPTLRLLLDTNIVIALEPFDGPLESGLHAAAVMQRLASEQGHSLFIHPATRDDLIQGSHSLRHAQRLAVLEKYRQLVDTPVPKALRQLIGEQSAGSNGERDLRILSGLYCGAVKYLVTEDRGLRRWARRAGLAGSTLTINEAVDLLQGLSPALTEPPPLVQRLPSYALDADDDIFSSLRSTYAGFDTWIAKVREDHDRRVCLVVRPSSGGPYAAVGIAKLGEADNGYGLPAPTIKVSTFKVSDEYRGRKYGELLLKALFQLATEHGSASLYVEVFADQDILIEQLINFGFTDTDHRTPRGELVLAKVRQPTSAQEAADLAALEYHIRYGPPAISSRADTYVIPIQPRWHRQLFPDAPVQVEGQFSLIETVTAQTVQPWGNALRKAYLCHSKSNGLRPGDTLLFYRSGDQRSIDVVGVIEQTLRSNDPAEILAFVGQRTVYNATDIQDMCGRAGGLLAILFRQDRFLEPAVDLTELRIVGALRGPPQSIVRVREEGAEWVQDLLNESR